MNKASELAKHEVGWWMAHHRKDWKKATDHMTKEYILQFGISQEQAEAAVKLRMDATKQHDIAEKYEDGGNQKEADIHWKKTEELLKKHFEILLKEKGI